MPSFATYISPLSLPLRTPWEGNFPLVDIHATESNVKKNPAYNSTKMGNRTSSMKLVDELVSDECVATLKQYNGRLPIIVPVHGIEGASVNAIPMALSVYLSECLGFELLTDIVQITKAGHTDLKWHPATDRMVSDKV